MVSNDYQGYSALNNQQGASDWIRNTRVAIIYLFVDSTATQQQAAASTAIAAGDKRRTAFIVYFDSIFIATAVAD